MEMVVHRWNGESKDQSYRIHELYREKTVDEKVKLLTDWLSEKADTKT